LDLHKEFDLGLLAGTCETKKHIILASYEHLRDIKWLRVGIDINQKLFIYAPKWAEYNKRREHEGSVKDTTRCQQGEYPTPSPSPSPKESKKEKVPELKPKEDLDDFENFWKVYPARNGKKFGKLDAQEKFLAITKEDRSLVIKAAQNYAASELVQKGVGVKDAKRFLQKNKNGSEFWRDWIEPEIPGSKNSPSTCSKRIEDKGRFKPCGKPATKAIGKNPLCDDCHTAFLKEQKL